MTSAKVSVPASVAYPSLLAAGVREGLTDYLSTTFALTSQVARKALQGFLLNPESGIFRGPYYRVRTPFRTVDGTWVNPLDWTPPGFRPYRHQAQAFERLGSRDSSPQPTVVTTGTGSGKTESFLIPLLDHARREHAKGSNGGIKAVILYPMNALVTDQARRLARLLHDEPALKGVTAGVYIGGQGEHQTATRDHLVDDRYVLRDSPPDILLTNYRMLDLLLLRPQDQSLWSASRDSLQYLVLDEFHTYDGAQGTDVAMLLRRFGAALGLAVPGKPLGRITPVATSATLGGGEDGPALRDFAATVFGCKFDEDSIIGEHRLDPVEVLDELDQDAIVPLISEIRRAQLPDADEPGSWQPLACNVLGFSPSTQQELARGLAKHPLTHVIVSALAGGPQTATQVMDQLNGDPRVALAWGPIARTRPQDAADALARFVALLSAARSEGSRPWLIVEVQLWARDVRRVVREVAPEPRFRWWTDGPAEEPGTYLPAVYCRVCGESGWQAVATELDEYLDGTPEKIWRSAITDRGKMRTVLLAQEGSLGSRTLDRDGLDLDKNGDDDLSVTITPDSEAAKVERCPSCGYDEGIRFLGSSVATEISVALTSLFGSDGLPAKEKKTLVFTDSVQDAAHRAAFIEGRAFTFNFRSALLRAVKNQPQTLSDAASALSALPIDDLYAITPPDFIRRLGLEGTYLSGVGSRALKSLLARRLAFQVQLEAGLRSRLGRTLELTGAASVDVSIDLSAASKLAKEIHVNLPEAGMTLPDLRAYRVWLLGLLDRLRTRGGIHHPWLDAYLAESGRRWQIWGHAPRGMPQFPRGRSAPTAFTTGTGTDFDSLGGRGSWLVDWSVRCLQVSVAEAAALLYQVVPALAVGPDAVLRRNTGKNDAGVFVLDPAKILLQRTTDEQAADGRSQMHCDVCQHIQPTSPNRSEWLGAPCPRMRCTGHLSAAAVAVGNYYRRLYRSDRIRRVVTQEHTGLLDRATRERVETAFKNGTNATDPNVLTCTPTLELGIDIGEMSAVALASLPRSTASYLQRVGRAGRSTGNALVVATVPSGPRDLYYFSDPTNLISGRVTPPNTYLRATELLQRQYLAFCLDAVARGTITLSSTMPPTLGPVIGPKLKSGSWLQQFADHLASNASQLSDRFLDLYGDTLDELTAADLRAFAADGLIAAIGDAVTEWHEHRGEIRRRLKEISEELKDLRALGHLDDDQTMKLRQWTGEWKVLRKSDEAMSDQETFTGLVGLSLLPNYNLQDDATTLDVSLWWTSDDQAGAHDTMTSEYSVERGSRGALTEFAPGSTFYAFGQQIQIDAVDPGPAASPHWSLRRLCPGCGWGSSHEPIAECPRCGDAAVSDTGAVHRLLPLTRVSASHHRDDTVIDDDSDERIRKQFSVITGIDVAPQHISGAWRLQDRVFGAEYARIATIRAVNLGPLGVGGAEVSIAGEHVNASLFRTCSGCGIVHLPGTDEAYLRHRGWCPTRKGHPADWQELALSHELTTQAVRILLPVSTFEVKRQLVAFAGALLLGLQRDFGGDPQHLSVVTASMPDQEKRPRRFLVLHDLVAGGTGYLDRFGDPQKLRHILTLARDELASCPCREERRVACHRCLLAVVPGRDVPHADRALAVELLDDLLSHWTTVDLDSVTNVDIGSIELNELELRFREALKAWVLRQPNGTVTDLAAANGTQLSLSFESSEGAVRSWLVKTLHGVKAGAVTTEPDFLLTRQDAKSAQIAVYLDGKAYHASVAHNRTADDALKRTSLRSDGYRVISLTFADVEDWELRLTDKKGKVADLVPNSTAAAAKAHVADPRISLLWGPSTGLLTGLLEDPEAGVWSKGAGALAGQVAFDRKVSGPFTTPRGELMSTVIDWAATGNLAASGEGDLVSFPSTTFAGVPLLAVLDTANTSGPVMGVVAVLDDRDDEVAKESHDAHWRDWLRWSNALQFLADAPAGAAPGWAEVWTQKSLGSLRERYLTFDAPPPPADVSWSKEWALVLEYTDDSVHDLVHELADGGFAVPIPGEEVGTGHHVWQVELAWPDSKVAVVIDHDDSRDDWLRSAGWTVVRVTSVAATLTALKSIWEGDRR